MAVPSISDFAASLQFGGARPSLFNVTITNPAVTGIDSDFSLKCHAATLPSWNITPIPIAYFGRPIKVAGNRIFNDWQVSVINDEDFTARDRLETWSNAMNTLQGNVRGFGSSSPSLYKSVAEVNQYSQTGEIIRSYKMSGLFPTVVGEITLDWSQDGQIEVFPVTFSIDYFYIGNVSTGDAGGV